MKVARFSAGQLASVARVGVDLAKSSFAVCAVDRRDQQIVKRTVNWRGLEDFLRCLPQGCVVGMEACGGAHRWARFCQGLGLNPRLMAPQAVKPYIGEQKNDLRDARGICEAAGRPTIQPVRIKSLAETDWQTVIRTRQLRVDARRSLGNQLHGLLLEYGFAVAKGAAALKVQVPAILEDGDNALSIQTRQVLASVYDAWRAADALVAEADAWVHQLEREVEASRRLQTIPGIGPIIALALLALVGDAKHFKNGRAISAWLGLTPQQWSTGGKTRLGEMSKHGQVYLRTLLIHGARAALHGCRAKDDRLLNWARDLAQRKGKNKAAVALANKLARIAWKILASGTVYQPA